MYLQELILHQNTRDICHHTLLTEADNSTIEIGAFLQLHTFHDDIIQQLKAESCSLMGFGGLVYHGLDKRVIQFLFIGDGIEVIGILGVGLGNDFDGVFLCLLGKNRIAVDVITSNLTLGILRLLWLGGGSEVAVAGRWIHNPLQ